MREILVFLEYYPLYLGVFITLVPIGILIYKWRGLDTPFRLLFLYLSCRFLSDILMLYYAAVGQNNLWLHNLMVPLRYLLLSGVFYYFLESAKIRNWIRISVPLFLIFAVSDIYFSNHEAGQADEYLYVRYSGIVECLLMLLWILLYFYEIFRLLKVENLLKSARFLVAVAWLLYYASLVFLVPLFYYIYRSRSAIKLGILENVPDCMEILAVLITTVAVSLPSVRYD